MGQRRLVQFEEHGVSAVRVVATDDGGVGQPQEVNRSAVPISGVNAGFERLSRRQPVVPRHQIDQPRRVAGKPVQSDPLQFAAGIEGVGQRAGDVVRTRSGDQRDSQPLEVQIRQDRRYPRETPHHRSGRRVEPQQLSEVGDRPAGVIFGPFVRGGPSAARDPSQRVDLVMSVLQRFAGGAGNGESGGGVRDDRIAAIPERGPPPAAVLGGQRVIAGRQQTDGDQQMTKGGEHHRDSSSPGGPRCVPDGGFG